MLGLRKRLGAAGLAKETDAARDQARDRQASSNPSGKTTRFCVFYQGLGMKHFDFSGDKDEQIKQSDRDDACQ
jgi:hypothetical protein